MHKLRRQNELLSALSCTGCEELCLNRDCYWLPTINREIRSDKDNGLHVVAICVLQPIVLFHVFNHPYIPVHFDVVK